MVGASSRDIRTAVRIVTPLLIVGLGLGTLVEYRRASKDAERRFGEHQMYQARKAAHHLGDVFREVRKFLTLVSVLGADTPHNRRLISMAVGGLQEHGALLAFQVDRAGHAVMASQDASNLTEVLQRLQLNHHEYSAESGAMHVVGPFKSPLAASGSVVMTSMLAANRRAVTYILLDWGGLQRQIERISKLSEDSYAWVLDHQGRLVMHPKHSEQLGHSALAVGPACRKCHPSFELHKKMVLGLTGAGRISIAGDEAKLVAYAPFEVGTHRWSLGVATSAKRVVTQGLLSNSPVFALIGAIMLVMITGALLLDRESSRRIRFAEAFNRELESKVAERTSELHALYERLSALQAQQGRIERATVVGEMASIVAHEIRTPLNALSINAQRIGRLLRRDGDEQRQKAEDLLGSLQTEIQRISSLLEDHLLALVRHRRSRPEKLDLNEQTMDAIRFMESEANRHKVRLSPKLAAGTLPVRADPAKLRQILLNIILNGIQAMRDGGTIRLSTHRAVSGKEATVEIQDNGPGINGAAFGGDNGNLEKIFRPFVTTKEEGTGLGLAICARLIKDMNGRITVHSKPNEGASFDVTLPVVGEGEELS